MHKFNSYFLAGELIDRNMDLGEGRNSDRIGVKVGEKIIQRLANIVQEQGLNLVNPVSW
jgi:hypothetical protein